MVGTCSGSVAVISACPPSVELGDQPPPALGIELAHHVVEEQQRELAPGVPQRLAFGEQEREQPEPLLALRAVAPQRSAAERDLDLVPMRAEARVAAGDVTFTALGELGDERVEVVLDDPRPVGDRRRPRQAEILRRGRERRARAVRRPPPAPRSAAGPARRAPGPRPSSASGVPPAPDPGQEVVALRERARVLPRQLGAGRPDRAGEAIEMRAPRTRRALDQRQSIGHEDADRGRRWSSAG